MVKEAAVVLRGTVLNQTSMWSEDKSIIFTVSTIRVVETLAGRCTTKIIQVRQLGGQVGEVSLMVPGTAQLKTGLNVLLFLRSGPTFHYLVGMSQGHYNVLKIKGHEVVTRSTAGLHKIGHHIKDRAGHELPAAQHEKYSAFANRIRHYARKLGK